MSTADITIEGTAEQVQAFMDLILPHLSSFPSEDGKYIDCEVSLDNRCQCGGDVVGTILSDGSLSYYCLDCDADLTRGE